MAGLNSPNVLNTKNYLSSKDIVKRTTALTLLLSMTALTACTINGVDDGGLGNIILGFVGCMVLSIPITFGAITLNLYIDGKLYDIEHKRNLSKDPHYYDDPPVRN